MSEAVANVAQVRTRSRRLRVIAWLGAGVVFGVVMSVATVWVPMSLIDPKTAAWNQRLLVDDHGALIGTLTSRPGVRAYKLRSPVLVLDSPAFSPNSPNCSNTPPAAWAIRPVTTQEQSVITYGGGWPCACVRGTIHAGFVPSDTRYRGWIRTGGDSPAHRDWFVAGLPVLPYWPGLLADIVFWGSPVPLLALAVGAIRNARRRRVGCCATCGYDLTGLRDGVCPECGVTR